MNLEKFFFKKISLWTLILTIIFGIICIIWFGSLVLKSRTALKIAKIPLNFKTIITGQNEPGLLSPEKRFGEEKGSGCVGAGVVPLGPGGPQET